MGKLNMSKSKRKHILKVAYELFVKKGYENTINMYRRNEHGTFRQQASH